MDARKLSRLVAVNMKNAAGAKEPLSPNYGRVDYASSVNALLTVKRKF